MIAVADHEVSMVPSGRVLLTVLQRLVCYGKDGPGNAIAFLGERRVCARRIFGRCRASETLAKYAWVGRNVRLILYDESMGLQSLSKEPVRMKG